MASFTLTCESDFFVIGLQEGEDFVTPVRLAATLVALSIASSWYSLAKIRRLSLFFAHWLSGLVLGLGYLAEDIMVTVCWTSSNLEGLMKFLKFIELASSNMLAITNLAICVNLALIISSHRTVSRVKSVSSPLLIMLFLAISTSTAAAVVPFMETAAVHGTGFVFINSDKRRNDFIKISMFYVEFLVGVCMFFIVAWLLLFRMEEIKACWKLHARIRYYFGLTALGTAVNLALGICGTIFIVGGDDETILVVVVSWVFRYMHIALDTVVLYGVLRERYLDERGDVKRSSAALRGSEDEDSAEMSKRVENPLSTVSRTGSGGSRGSLNADERAATPPRV